MKINTPIKINDTVRLKLPITGISSPLYVINYINENSVLCEYFKGTEQQNTKSVFQISDLEKIIYGNGSE